MGFAVGDSLVEDSCLVEADQIIREAEQREVQLLLACDSRIVRTDCMDNQVHTVNNEHIPDGWTGVDIGELTQNQFKENLQDCQTVLWNGNCE